MLVLVGIVARQTRTFSQAGAPPNIAFDIAKADIDLVLKNAPPSPPDHVTYLSVRPDPDRVLPAGYVYPLLLKNLPPTGPATQ